MYVYIYIYITTVVKYCYLERGNNRVLKSHVKTLSYFQIGASLF